MSYCKEQKSRREYEVVETLHRFDSCQYSVSQSQYLHFFPHSYLIITALLSLLFPSDNSVKKMCWCICLTL